MTEVGHAPIPFLVAALLLATAPASAEVSGRYTVTGTSVKVKVISWGEHCGPRPTSSSRRGGKTVEVRPAGAHLVLGGQRTDTCWSQNPKVQRRRASATAGRWEVVCETPTDDPRYEHGEYTLELVGADHLRFTELSRYNWRIEGDHCEAMVKLIRTYEPERAAGAAPAKVVEAPAKRCTGPPGPAQSIEVRPARARVGPGDRVCFRASGRDAEGCQTVVTPSWTMVGGAGESGRLSPDGCFVAGAERGRAEIAVASGELTARAVVEIVAAADIGSLVAARLAEAGDDTAELEDGPPALAQPGAVQGLGGASASEAGERGGALLWALLAAALAAAVLLGLAAVLLMRRSRRRDTLSPPEPSPASRVVASARPPPGAAGARFCPTCRREFDGETFFCPDDATELVAAAEADSVVSPGENKICPRCRRGYPASAMRCTVDSEQLLPYSTWRASQLVRSSAEPGGGMICPKCAARYDRAEKFCQQDGSKLVPIN